MAGTIGAEPANGSHAKTAPAPDPGGGVPVGWRMARVIDETRSWLEQRQALPPAARTPLSTREWLARAAFTLLAVTTVMAIVLTALGLLDVGDTAGLLMPIVALASVIVGFYLGAETARQRPAGGSGQS